MSSKEKVTLTEGQTYMIDGIPMVYEFTESSKNYFQKIDPDGNPKGRLRVMLGDPDHVASLLLKKSEKYRR